MIHLFRIRGIPVRIDYGWLLIFAVISWSLASGYFPRVIPELSPAAYWLQGLVAALLLFVSVFLHELSHALVALAQGVRVGSITLHIFGGVSQLESEPATPAAEFLIAAVGPLTSFAIAGCFWTIGQALPAGPPWALALTGYLGVVNFVVGIFNLVPGFPLDGGRILRATLWAWRGSLDWATRWASRAGSAFAGLLMAVGILRTVAGDVVGGLWFIMIGLFLHQAAQASYQLVRVRARLEPLRVLEIMTPAVDVEPARGRAAAADPVVSPRDSAWLAFTRLSRSRGRRVMVVDDGHVVGVVSDRDLQPLLRDAHSPGRTGARRAA
ncbi:MAG TPA: site-2 protease family protein [Methylomirabilota bacterium]|nr:site-2 protease family protein [Methylomirabilota bacterium]